MKLVLYGGGDADDNYELGLINISLTKKKFPKVVFIPSSSYEGEYDFHEFVDQFQSYGIDHFIYFPIDIPFDNTLLAEILQSDMIHLGGGNTYYFLRYLRRSGMLAHLKSFVKKGGVLSGLSAGGIIMTPNILTASYPYFDRDENDQNVKNLKALNLTHFEFFPHYRNSKRYEYELLEQSLRSINPIIASPDGHGIVIDNDSMIFHKKNYIFHRGKKIIF